MYFLCRASTSAAASSSTRARSVSGSFSLFGMKTHAPPLAMQSLQKTLRRKRYNALALHNGGVVLRKIWLIVKNDFSYGSAGVAVFSISEAAWKNCEELARKEIDSLKAWEEFESSAVFKVRKLKSEDFPIHGFGVYVKEKQRLERLAASFCIKELPFDELPKPSKFATIIEKPVFSTGLDKDSFVASVREYAHLPGSRIADADAFCAKVLEKWKTLREEGDNISADGFLVMRESYRLDVRPIKTQ